MSTHPSGVRAGHSFGRVVEKVGPFRAGLALLFRPHLQAVCCDCAMSACRQGLPLRMFISPCVGFALWPMFFLLLDRTHLYKQIAAPWDASSRPLERKELLQQGKTHSELRGDHPQGIGSFSGYCAQDCLLSIMGGTAIQSTSQYGRKRAALGFNRGPHGVSHPTMARGCEE